MKIYYTQSQISGKDFICAVLKKEYGVTDPVFTRNEHGKPALCNSPLFFNLSHSGNLTALAVGEEEVGLDIEERKERDLSALRSRLSPTEREEDFFHVWTAKEAYIKFRGESLAALYRRLEYRHGELFCDGAPVPARLYSAELDGCVLTLCTARPVSVELVPFE